MCRGERFLEFEIYNDQGPKISMVTTWDLVPVLMARADWRGVPRRAISETPNYYDQRLKISPVTNRNLALVPLIRAYWLNVPRRAMLRTRNLPSPQAQNLNGRELGFGTGADGNGRLAHCAAEIYLLNIKLLSPEARNLSGQNLELGTGADGNGRLAHCAGESDAWGLGAIAVNSTPRNKKDAKTSRKSLSHGEPEPEIPSSTILQYHLHLPIAFSTSLFPLLIQSAALPIRRRTLLRGGPVLLLIFHLGLSWDL